MRGEQLVFLASKIHAHRLRFFVNISNIPPVLRWLRYFSTLGFTLEALSVNEVGSGLKIVVRSVVSSKAATLTGQ
jgi:hypothetical protein